MDVVVFLCIGHSIFCCALWTGVSSNTECTQAQRNRCGYSIPSIFIDKVMVLKLCVINDSYILIFSQ